VYGDRGRTFLETVWCEYLRLCPTNLTSLKISTKEIVYRNRSLKCKRQKGKVVPVFLTEYDAVKALDGGEWSTSRPGRLTPRERAPELNRRLSGPQSRSGRGCEEKNS
jgi:hypothetical protein